MKVVAQNHCVIGEGPIWNEFNGKLYQVNGFADEILEIDIYKKVVKIRKLTFSVAAIAFTKKGETIVSCLDGAFILNDDDSRTPLYDPEKIEIRLGSDAKVGPNGKLYIGTQSKRFAETGDEVDGKLYSVDSCGNVKVLLDGLVLSNGFDWSIDEKFLYHTDSASGIVKEYAFDKYADTLTYTGRSVYVKGVDGLTVSNEGYLYAACWGQSHIAVVDTVDMQIERHIDVPAKIPTSCCFAGNNMDKLVVVSASCDVDLSVDTKAGYTFVWEAKTSGRKPFLFG